MGIGTRCPDKVCHHPDIDLRFVGKDGVETFTHKDGAPYSPE